MSSAGPLWLEFMRDICVFFFFFGVIRSLTCSVTGLVRGRKASAVRSFRGLKSGYAQVFFSTTLCAFCPWGGQATCLTCIRESRAELGLDPAEASRTFFFPPLSCLAALLENQVTDTCTHCFLSLTCKPYVCIYLACCLHSASYYVYCYDRPMSFCAFLKLQVCGPFSFTLAQCSVLTHVKTWMTKIAQRIYTSLFESKVPSVKKAYMRPGTSWTSFPIAAI